tara:strand:+ start:3767 stop:3892 length:126 start_codon:yes stop_codon:yes gene_type:complete
MKTGSILKDGFTLEIQLLVGAFRELSKQNSNNLVTETIIRG